MIDPGALAEGARLLHIGFRKCGTTSLQAALRRARIPMAGFGVVYPGTGGNHTPAALAVTGRTHGWVALGATAQPIAKWDELVEEVAALEPRQRAVVSSEFFDVADESTIATIVSGLGGEAVQVVATARPLSKILPSAWQQQVKVGLRASYGDWLRLVLDSDGQSKTHRTFWERHDQAAVLSRWAGVLGPERVTLVVLDDQDRRRPFRSFEAMLGLPDQTLVEDPSRANRSMTGAEVELIRRVNVEIFSTDVTWDEYSSWIRQGAAQRMVSQRTPGPDELPTQTPEWALERACAISDGFVRQIEGLGLDVVGDLQGLLSPVPTPGVQDDTPDPSSVPIDVAVQAVLGAGFSKRTQTQTPPAPPKPAGKLVALHARPARELSAGQLARLLVRRVRRRLGRVARGGEVAPDIPGGRGA